MEKFNWKWKYPDNMKNTEIVFDDNYETGSRIVFRNKNGEWSGYIIEYRDILSKKLEKEYQKYKSRKREEKLKRILG